MFSLFIILERIEELISRSKRIVFGSQGGVILLCSMEYNQEHFLVFEMIMAKLWRICKSDSLKISNKKYEICSIMKGVVIQITFCFQQRSTERSP